MKKNYALWAFVAVCFLFTAACKKNDSTPAATVNDYTQLKPGNYWIYQSFLIAENGTEQPGTYGSPGALVFDSVYVEKDTVINNNTYHKLIEPDASAGSPAYLRDSLNYLVNIRGQILFSSDDYVHTFASITRDARDISHDSVFRMELKMGDKGKIVTVPAGVFTTASFFEHYTFYPFAATKEVISTRSSYGRYAIGVGKVIQLLPFYAATPENVERRLVRYHVK